MRETEVETNLVWVGLMELFVERFMLKYQKFVKV
jgi:hypothetical protein